MDKGADMFRVTEPEWVLIAKKAHPDPLPRHPSQLVSAYRNDFGIDPQQDKPANKVS
jgi:hypothetical protein